MLYEGFQWIRTCLPGGDTLSCCMLCEGEAIAGQCSERHAPGDLLYRKLPFLVSEHPDTLGRRVLPRDFHSAWPWENLVCPSTQLESSGNHLPIPAT